MKKYARSFPGRVWALLLFAACNVNADPQLAGPGLTDAGDQGSGRGSGRSGGAGGGASLGPTDAGTDFMIRFPDASGVDAPGSGTGTGDGTGGAGGGGGRDPSMDEKTCGLVKIQLERVPPDLLLVLDRSGSMRMNVPGTMNNRWQEVTAALDETLMQSNALVNWGLKLYPTTSACNVSEGVEVPIAAMNYPMVGGTIRMTLPNMDAGGTPTQKAVRAATGYLKTLTTKNPKYIVLATDGEPNCRNNSSSMQDAMGSVESIADALKEGFHTFVVGIATAGTPAHGILNDMAAAGGEARMDETKYYAIANKQDLVKVLGSITGQVTNCTFPLDKKPPSPMDVAVKIDGMKVGMDAWMYGPGMGSVLIVGDWCEKLKKGEAKDVQIIFGCPNVIIE